MQKTKQPNQLQRGLEERHITLMSLGAAIGVGLFLGSASAIKLAGPGIIIAYAFAGMIIFFIMRALGEMAIEKPVAGSFSQYARDYLGQLPGFLTGWNYWLLWIVTCMAEITAAGIYMEYWFPDVPRWIWALLALGIMVAVNFLAVKAFGELEFWFAAIKIVTIIFMIVSGLGIIIFGIGNGGIATGISNLWENGGLFPNGLTGVLLSLQMVMFAFLGVEMIGITAGEVKNPKKTLRRAIDTVFWRILLFYVGTMIVMMSIYPWQEIGVKGSPFVLVFDQLGIPAAAGIINFVVLTAALSSCNGGIFSTARMLFNLAENGDAPKKLGMVNKNGVPSKAVMLTGSVLLFGVVLNYLVPEKIFIWLTAVSTFGAIWTWSMILLSQIKYRRTLSKKHASSLTYKMPLFPFTSYFSLAFLAMVIGMMAYSPDTRIAVIVGPLFLATLVAFYYGKGYHKKNQIANQQSTVDLERPIKEA
ncbi:amino acid permease [Bacillus sp. EB01]|uniref:amino acid permease n=1 Tax=Bacillus sp. EB01 TaxID=1347086 RepID=UPI0005C7817A|nr:amino acid permease [Bacillus sp. EB01]